MKDVYDQIYYQPNSVQAQDHQHHNKKSNNSSGSTVLGRFLKLGKSKSDAHGSNHGASNLKRRHAPNNNSNSELEDEFRLTPSQLRGVERMVHKANMRKDVSRSHSWIFGSVKLASDMPPGYGYDPGYAGGSGSGAGSSGSPYEVPNCAASSEYATPTNQNMNFTRGQTAAEDFCCSCDYQEDFNFLAGTPVCKACNNNNNMFALEGAAKYLKSNGIVVGGNKKFEQESGKKFASSVRKLTWKSLKQAVKKRPSLDSLKTKPTFDWLPSSGSGPGIAGPMEPTSYSNEDLLGSAGSPNYFFPDKKNGFYTSCTDLNSEGTHINVANITATASVRVRPKRSRQSWHFPNEFGPVPNYQEEEDAGMYHSEWDLRQYLPMPYEEWLTNTNPHALSPATSSSTQAGNPSSDFDACFEPPTNVKVSLNNNNNIDARAGKGNRPVSRGSNNDNTKSAASTKTSGIKGDSANNTNESSTDLYSNGGVKRFSILYSEATAYQLNQSTEDDHDPEDEEEEEDYADVGSMLADSDQVRIAGQGIFMMSGNNSNNGCGRNGNGIASVTVARSNSGRHIPNPKGNLSRSNHPHHLLLNSKDGSWSDTQLQSQYAPSHNRDRSQLLPDKGIMGLSSNNNHNNQQQSLSFTSFQQQPSNYAAPGPSSSGSNSSNNSGSSNSNGASSRMSDGNGPRLNNAKNSTSGASNNRNNSNSTRTIYESDSLTHGNYGNGNANNNSLHHQLQQEIKSRAGTPQNQQRKDNNNGEDFDQQSNSGGKNLRFNGESGKSSGKGGHSDSSGNKYGALRRRKGNRSSSSSPGKNLLRETIYEEESEHGEQGELNSGAGDSEVSYSVKIVVSQTPGNGDYVKPILKNRGHYATPNSTSSLHYANSSELSQQSSADHQMNSSQYSDSSFRTRKKVQFNSEEQVVVCGGLSEPELDDEIEDEDEIENASPESTSSQPFVVVPNNNNSNSCGMKPAEISTGGMTKMETTRKSNSSGVRHDTSANRASAEEEVVQVSRVKLKTPGIAPAQVNNLQANYSSKLNTKTVRLVGNESNGSQERTSLKNNNTANANATSAPVTTTNVSASSLDSATIKAENTTTSATLLKGTSDEERGATGTGESGSCIKNETTTVTSFGSCTSFKAERIGSNEEQTTISKVKGCQPQKILNPNSLLFNDTTRIRLNQARPSLEHTFQLSFDQKPKSTESTGKPSSSSARRGVRTSHSFRGNTQQLMQIPNRPKEPPPPPPVPNRILPPIPTETDHNTKSNGYAPGHLHRSTPTHKSQISLPMPMLGFSTTNNNVVMSGNKPVGVDRRTAAQAQSKSMQQNQSRNKSSALTEKCDALEKVLSQKLDSSKTPAKTGKINSPPSISRPKSKAATTKNGKSEGVSRPTSSHARDPPPPRPPPISPKPQLPLPESDYKVNKQQQGNQNRISSKPMRELPSLPVSIEENPQPDSLIENCNGEPHNQNIEIVTRENSVSEIRIYSGTKNSPEYGSNSESSQAESKIVPNDSNSKYQQHNPKEIHYAATDLFQKDGSFNFSMKNSEPQNYCQSSSSSTSSSSNASSRPQSTSVVLIIDTGSTEAEAAAVANSISKVMKPNPSQAVAPPVSSPIDLLREPQSPFPTMTSQSSCSRIEGKGVVGQSTEEDEPVYDDVINHSKLTKDQEPRLASAYAAARMTDSVSPPTSPPPIPPSLPPPLGDNDDSFYSDIDHEDEDSGTCLGLRKGEDEEELCEDIIYDDTLSLTSNNYELNQFKNSNEKSKQGSEIIHSTTTKSPQKTKPEQKFSPVVNHSKPIKTQLSSMLATTEDEPMYDDVLNLISAESGVKASQGHESDSGTETDSPPPLPASGPPLHLLPKISMELPLIPIPHLNPSITKAGSAPKLQDIKAKTKNHDLSNAKREPGPGIKCHAKENKAVASLAGILKSVAQEIKSEECFGNNSNEMTVSIGNSRQNTNCDDDNVLDRTRTLLNELNDKLSKLNFSPDYSSYVSKVVVSSSSESSGVEEDYNSEKNYSFSNGSDAASSGDDNYKLSAVSKLVTETISMARGKFLDSMKLNSILGGNQHGGIGSPSPASDDTISDEPIYEEINENNANGNALLLGDSSPIYSDAFDAKSIFDGASRNEILSFLESIRDRLTNATTVSTAARHELNPDSPESSLTKKSRKFGEIERNDSGIGSESGSLVAVASNGKNGRGSILVDAICKDCNDAPVDPRINASSDTGETCSSHEILGGAERLELCRSCSRKRSERKEIILEIYETELKYGRDLRIVADEFFNPIQVAGLLSKEQLDQIFLNVTQLIEINSELTSLLKTAIDQAIGAQDEDLGSVTIGRIFLEIGEKMMSAFENYCTRQANAGALLTQLEKERELLRIFLRVSQMENAVLRRMNLPAFLMVPVQRVTRYPLLLSRLLKVTCADHPARDDLQLAHEKIEQHLEHMNKTTREVASVKLWRRISIINNTNNSSLTNRRGSGESDSASLRIRKMAFDVLDWSNFNDVTCVIENQLNIVNLNGKSLRNIYGCLLARGKDLDSLAIKIDHDIFFPPADDAIKEVKLALVRVKNTRFCMLREPLCLSKCVVSQGENEFQDFIEINEITTKNTYYLQAMDKQETSVWLRLLQCHAVCVGQWRKRRGALANIMMNGMIRHL